MKTTTNVAVATATPLPTLSQVESFQLTDQVGLATFDFSTCDLGVSF